jgi:predicted DNA-binding transcriptional regulator AlpA
MGNNLDTIRKIFVIGGRNMEITRLLKVSDVAVMTQLKASTIRKYVLKERIPFIKIDGAIRFDYEIIKLWIGERQKGAEKYQAILDCIEQ